MSKFDVSSFSVTGDLYIFKLKSSHLPDFEQFKVDVYLTNFGQVKTDPVWYFLLLWTGDSYFTEFGKDMPRKTIQTLSIW